MKWSKTHLVLFSRHHHDLEIRSKLPILVWEYKTLWKISSLQPQQYYTHSGIHVTLKLGHGHWNSKEIIIIQSSKYLTCMVSEEKKKSVLTFLQSMTSPSPSHRPTFLFCFQRVKERNNMALTHIIPSLIAHEKQLSANCTELRIILF